MFNIDEIAKSAQAAGFKVDNHETYLKLLNVARQSLYVSYKDEEKGEWFSLIVTDKIDLSTNENQFSRELYLSACAVDPVRQQILLDCFRSSKKLSKSTLHYGDSQVTEEEIERFFFG